MLIGTINNGVGYQSPCDCPSAVILIASYSFTMYDLNMDTLFCIKWLTRQSIFTHADILILVSEFVVVVIYLSGGLYRPLPTTVGTSLIIMLICGLVS